MERVLTTGEVIRRRREALGLSQRMLAALAGVSTRQVRRYEADEVDMRLDTAVAVAQALGISLSELAGDG